MLGNPAQGGRSTTAIREDMGFNSLAQFCTSFRQHFGMTPGEYRAAARQRVALAAAVRIFRRAVGSVKSRVFRGYGVPLCPLF
jgi:AraC-like DNA-binding protein